jgi:DNA-binding transcriptional MocR family regulator
MLQAQGSEAGMHLTVTLPKGFRDVEVAARAAAERLWLRPLSPSYIGKKVRHGFILGFGSTTIDSIPHGIHRLRSLLTER